MILDIKIKALLKTIDIILPKNALEALLPITEDIQMVIWYHIHTNKSGINKKNMEYLPAAIIQIALIFATQCSGRFPATSWMSSIEKFREDKLNAVV